MSAKKRSSCDDGRGVLTPRGRSLSGRDHRWRAEWLLCGGGLAPVSASDRRRHVRTFASAVRPGRFGVAPDHPKLKQVTRVFDRIADMPGFRFFGGVAIGEAPSISALRSCYHALILATGAPASRLMDVPGEGLPGSYQASDFVAWYNGHPDFQHCKFDLGAERAVIIGHGNVALDVARNLERRRTNCVIPISPRMPSMRLRPVAFGRSIWLDGAVRIRPALPQRSCRNLRSLPIVIRWSSWTAFQSSLQALMRTPRQRLRSLCFGHSRRDRSRSGGAVCSCSILPRSQLEATGASGKWCSVKVGKMLTAREKSLSIVVWYSPVSGAGQRQSAAFPTTKSEAFTPTSAAGSPRMGARCPACTYAAGASAARRGRSARTGHAVLKPWRTSLPICRSSMRRRVIPIACSQRSLYRDRGIIRAWERIDAKEVARGRPKGKKREKFIAIDEMFAAAGGEVAC